MSLTDPTSFVEVMMVQKWTMSVERDEITVGRIVERISKER